MYEWKLNKHTAPVLYIAHKLATQFNTLIVEILKQYFSTIGKKLGKCFGIYMFWKSIVNTMGGKHAVYCLEII